MAAWLISQALKLRSGMSRTDQSQISSGAVRATRAEIHDSRLVSGDVEVSGSGHSDVRSGDIDIRSGEVKDAKIGTGSVRATNAGTTRKRKK
jgi:hypothetical protein